MNWPYGPLPGPAPPCPAVPYRALPRPAGPDPAGPRIEEEKFAVRWAEAPLPCHAKPYLAMPSLAWHCRARPSLAKCYASFTVAVNIP